MHPALSIIAFTVLSGLGYGLAAVLGLGLLDPTAFATKAAYVTSLTLITIGLLSSTLHLGNPQRAWRAISQWRSSWLSREGLMAILTFLPLLWSAFTTIWNGEHSATAGLAAGAMGLATVFCTAMLYASLRSVSAWNTPLTPLCYLLFAVAGGFGVATLFALVGSGEARLLAGLATMALVAAWLAKMAWRHRMLTHRPRSTAETATGLGNIGRVRLFESPHGNDSYLTREMAYVVARRHATKLAKLAIVFGGLVPAIIFSGLSLLSMQLSAATAFIAMLAIIAHTVGMLIERWLFFAEAKHAVTNYYAR